MFLDFNKIITFYGETPPLRSIYCCSFFNQCIDSNAFLVFTHLRACVGLRNERCKKDFFKFYFICRFIIICFRVLKMSWGFKRKNADIKMSAFSRFSVVYLA